MVTYEKDDELVENRTEGFINKMPMIKYESIDVYLQLQL